MGVCGSLYPAGSWVKGAKASLCEHPIGPLALETKLYVVVDMLKGGGECGGQGKRSPLLPPPPGIKTRT